MVGFRLFVLSLGGGLILSHVSFCFWKFATPGFRPAAVRVAGWKLPRIELVLPLASLNSLQLYRFCPAQLEQAKPGIVAGLFR
jgi:hypothetical protein